jgi:uncharacterized protein (TIGR03083 family)
MTDGEEATPEPAQLPVAPGSVRTAVLAELGRLGAVVQDLTLDDWSKPSAVEGWSIGDVVAHLNLALGLSGRLLDAVVAGRGSGRVWKTVGEFSKKFGPIASPAVNAVNRTLPRVIDRALSPEVIKAQFAASSRTLQEKILRVGANDYTRPVYYRGGPWPLSFFLAAIVDELAVHGWDIRSRLDPQAHLSEDARAVLPWFFWSGTPFMLQMPKQMEGTIQATLSDPAFEMWWRVTASGAEQGVGQAGEPDVTLGGTSGTFVLTLAGRIPVGDALHTTSLSASGNDSLARAFLGAWRIL